MNLPGTDLVDVRKRSAPGRENMGAAPVRSFVPTRVGPPDGEADRAASGGPRKFPQAVDEQTDPDCFRVWPKGQEGACKKQNHIKQTHPHTCVRTCRGTVLPRWYASWACASWTKS